MELSYSRATETEKIIHKNYVEYAKYIGRVLRRHGIRCGLIKDNGTTTPSNPQQYPVYIVKSTISQCISGRSSMKLIYLKYERDNNMAQRIKTALEESRVPFDWDGDEYKSFVFEVPENKDL